MFLYVVRCLFGWGAVAVDGCLIHGWYPIRITHPNPAEQQGVHLAAVLGHWNRGYHRYGRLLLTTQIDRHAAGFWFYSTTNVRNSRWLYLCRSIFCGRRLWLLLFYIYFYYCYYSPDTQSSFLAKRRTEAAAKFHWIGLRELLIGLLIASDSSVERKWIKAQVEYSTINWQWHVPMANTSWPKKLPITIRENWQDRKKYDGQLLWQQRMNF